MSPDSETNWEACGRPVAIAQTPGKEQPALGPKSVLMTSSWRWDKDEEFQENVQPHALRKVSYVRQSYTILSFAECARRVYEDLAELRRAVERLETLLEQEGDQSAPDPARRIAIDICHFGESILRYQKRLVSTGHAYGFLHGKEAIPHAAHETHSPLSLHDLRQLAEDTRELLGGFNEMEQADSKFLVSSLDLPDHLMREFRLARDLFSVGFDDVGLLIAGRGLEAVLRAILAERRISTGGPAAKPAAEARLNEMIEILEKLRWKVDNRRFLPRGAVEILHWLRTTRNIGAHAQTEEAQPLSPPRELAFLIAQVANRLWQLHISNRRKRLIVSS